MEMSSKTQKNPSIRFKGFTDAWEQRKLGDTFEFSVSTNSLSRAQLNYEKGNIKSIHYGDILIKYNSILEITKDKIPFITDGSIEKYKPNLLENGDVVFADAAEDETVGKAVEINGISDEYVVAGLHTIVARPKEKMAKYFSGYYINADVYQRQLLRLMQGTKVSSISKGNLKKTIVAYPKNLAEQQKIGSFFKQLDNAIALHQRQLDNYKVLKKAILQKIFNQELRFKDEKGNEYPKWMRKTVNDIGDVVTGTTPSTKEKAYYNNGIYPWVTPTDIIQKNIDSTPRKLTEQGLSKGRMLPENTILVTCIASIGKNAILKQKGSCNQQINAIVCNNNHNYEFVFYLMEKNTDVLKSLAGKGTMDIVNKDIFSKMHVNVPCLEEQLIIGKFLSELDGKIEDEHKFVNLMKKQKQGLMQRMFV